MRGKSGNGQDLNAALGETQIRCRGFINIPNLESGPGTSNKQKHQAQHNDQTDQVRESGIYNQSTRWDKWASLTMKLRWAGGSSWTDERVWLQENHHCRAADCDKLKISTKESFDATHLTPGHRGSEDVFSLVSVFHLWNKLSYNSAF